MPELRKLIALISVQFPYVNSAEDFAVMAQAYLHEMEREAQQRLRRERTELEARVERRVRQRIERESEEAELWRMDKRLSPAPIRKLLSAIGY